VSPTSVDEQDFAAWADISFTGQLQKRVYRHQRFPNHVDRSLGHYLIFPAGNALT